MLNNNNNNENERSTQLSARRKIENIANSIHSTAHNLYL